MTETTEKAPSSKSQVNARRASARQRQEEASKRTPQQQLERLDQLLGKDVGAVKERARLQARIKAGK